MRKYQITRKDDNSRKGRKAVPATTTEIREFASKSALEDFCWELSDCGWFTVTWIEVEEGGNFGFRIKPILVNTDANERSIMKLALISYAKHERKRADALTNKDNIHRADMNAASAEDLITKLLKIETNPTIQEK